MSLFNLFGTIVGREVITYAQASILVRQAWDARCISFDGILFDNFCFYHVVKLYLAVVIANIWKYLKA